MGRLRNQDLKAPETWHEVGPASTPPAPDFCVDPSNTGVFCDEFPGGQNPWDNYGGGFATAAFYKDQLGIVHLRGLVHATSNSGGVNPMERAIFRLPAGYRPDQRRMFASVGQDGIGGVEVAPARIDVYPDGLVTFINDCATGVSNCSATGPFVTLDGISFRPDE